MTKRNRPQHEYIRAGDLTSSLPVNPLFVEGLLAYYENPGAYPVRTVAARKLSIPDGFDPTPEGLAIMRDNVPTMRAQHAAGAAPPIAVLETIDGRLWAYDDVHAVAAFHELAPLAMLRVVIVGRDETPIPSA